MRLITNSRTILLALCCVAMTLPALAQLDLPRSSPLGKLYQRVGMTDVEIEFSRPGVKGRMIWGDLVPYGEVWRTGANNATTISFSTDVTINGAALPAGKYALHTIPGENEWQIIFNSDWDKGGTTYEPEKDALIVKVTPINSGEHLERMAFEIPRVSDDGAVVQIRWEHLIVPFSVGVDTTSEAQKHIETELPKAERWQDFNNAANWALTNETAEVERVQWVTRSVEIEANWFNTSLQARILAKAGNKAGAIAAAKRAIEIGKSQNRDVSSMEELMKELM